MRYLRLFGVVVAMCAVGAMFASSALALPSLLIGTVGEGASTWTGESTSKTELQKKNGKTVTCKAATGEATVEAKKPLGAFHIHFTGCKEEKLAVACTGEGEAGEVILSLGSWHLVYDTLKAGLTGSGVAILFLPAAVKFTCGGLVKVEVKAGGMVLCLILNPEALTKLFEFHCNLRGTPFGPEETKYDNETGTWVAITPLEANENGGAFEESVQAGLGLMLFPEDTLIMI
jgi:hypothetical protein